jgi:hypothetical protein
MCLHVVEMGASTQVFDHFFAFVTSLAVLKLYRAGIYFLMTFRKELNRYLHHSDLTAGDCLKLLVCVDMCVGMPVCECVRMSAYLCEKIISQVSLCCMIASVYVLPIAYD